MNKREAEIKNEVDINSISASSSAIDDSPDQTTSEELAFFEAMGSKAGARDAWERSRHDADIAERIGVIQSKLNDREEEVSQLKHDNKCLFASCASLRQAKRTSGLTAIVESISVSVGATLLTLSSVSDELFAESIEPTWHYLFLGSGLSLSMTGVFAGVLIAAFGWPRKRKEEDGE